MKTIAIGLTLTLAAASPVLAQERTADPIKRGLQLTDFPRLIKLTDNVYGYEEIRSPGFTTVSMIVIGRNGVLIADGQGNAQATQKMLDRIRTVTNSRNEVERIEGYHTDQSEPDLPNPLFNERSLFRASA